MTPLYTEEIKKVECMEIGRDKREKGSVMKQDNQKCQK